MKIKNIINNSHQKFKIVLYSVKWDLAFIYICIITLYPSPWYFPFTLNDIKFWYYINLYILPKD